MSLPLYRQVALKRDPPEHDLKRGDVAVHESDIEDLRADEVLAVRPLADAI